MEPLKIYTFVRAEAGSFDINEGIYVGTREDFEKYMQKDMTLYGSLFWDIKETYADDTNSKKATKKKI